MIQAQSRPSLLCRATPLSALLVGLASAGAPAAALPGFERSRHFGEQIKEYHFEPDVNVHINAPAADSFATDKPTRLVLYALPNGNSIAQTIGRQRAPGVDWHFFIQHIGAQTRRMREIIKDQNRMALPLVLQVVRAIWLPVVRHELERVAW